MELNKKYYHTDIESGEQVEVSKETWEAINRGWEACKPKLLKDGKGIGKILVFGIGGEYDNNKELEKLFYKNYE